MAKKKDENKIVLERTYNVPLRKGYQKAPMYRRTKKAVNTLKEFLIKHMKSEDIKIGKYLNEELWKNGIKNPPHHIKIIVKKYETGTVFAEIEGYEAKEQKQKKKEETIKKKPVKKKESTKSETEISETKTETKTKEQIPDKKEEEIRIKDALGG